MKTYLLIIVSFLLLSVSGQTQNYQTINPESISCFENQAGYIYCIRVDSIKTSPEMILYPFAVNQPLSSNYCFSPYVASWIGTRIVIREEGTNVFYNYNNDSIIIHTLASLDDEWIAYKKSDEMQVQARVTEHDYISFIGLQDSVDIDLI